MHEIVAHWITTFEIDDLVDDLVHIARHPEFGWMMWEFHISECMNNGTCKLVKIDKDENGLLDEEFQSVINWCNKMHSSEKSLRWNVELYGYECGDDQEPYYGRRYLLQRLIKEYGVEDRPEDGMGFLLLKALCLADIVPEGLYLVESSW
jgi:hypothetical protein